MTDMEKLIEEVERGEAMPIFPVSYRAIGEDAHLALEAFQGDLNAAMALHEALLPGWQITANLLSVGPDSVCAIYGPLDPKAEKWVFAPKYEARASNHARAWLLCILRAKAMQP
jgi:hypothetical protein